MSGNVREYLTEEEFLKMYEDWTGWDFYNGKLMYQGTISEIFLRSETFIRVHSY